MPLVKALKSFKGKYGHIRAGMTFNPDPGYAREMQRKGWIEPVAEEEPGPGPQKKAPPAPDRNRNKPPAPSRAGKDQGGAKRTPPPNKKGAGTSGDTEQPPAGGGPVTSRSLRADLHSSAKTLTGSEAGAANLETLDRENQNSEIPPAG